MRAKAMARPLRKRSTCSVPGHGTRCEVAREIGASRYARTTEKRLAMEFELREAELQDQKQSL